MTGRPSTAQQLARLAVWFIGGFVALFFLGLALDYAGFGGDAGESPPPAGPAATSKRPAVVVDRFQLSWELDGNDLLLSVDTDLPDEGELSVSVRRTYYEVGNPEAYSREYFSEFEPVSAWRSLRRISLDAEAWKADLASHQDKMAKLGEGFAFEVDRIEPTVTVRAVLHANQDDPRFGGRGNPNLAGAAVNDQGFVEDQVVIPFPLDGPAPATTSRYASAHDLQAGTSYSISDGAPLMPGRTLEEAGGRQMQSLPAGTVIAVLEVDQVRNAPWYRVTVTGGELDGEAGWVNSTALVGQTIQRIE